MFTSRIVIIASTLLRPGILGQVQPKIKVGRFTTGTQDSHVSQGQDLSSGASVVYQRDGWLSACLRQHFLVLAYRRMGATALAIRLYEIEHGHRPDALDELVPDCIPAVPLDPFSADGAPIGYRPDADPPVLYSLGDDGVDDDGEFTLTDSGTVDWKAKDLVFFLNGDRPHPPPPAPATQPATTQSSWFLLSGNPPPSPPTSLASQPAGAEAVEDEGDEVGGGGGNDHDQSNAEQP